MPRSPGTELQKVAFGRIERKAKPWRGNFMAWSMEVEGGQGNPSLQDEYTRNEIIF